MKPVYITTPIYYPNGRPHLGSAYTTIVADFLARLYRALGIPSRFVTGTDEHGEKLERKAREQGKTPKEFVDEMAAEFREAWKKLLVEPDRFIRTTDPDHIETVKKVLEALREGGHIYKGKYEGLYCVGCERYYSEGELVEGKCPFHLKEPEHKSIDAYFFRMSAFRDRLLEFYRGNPKFLPPGRKEEILNRVKELQDLCISRPKEQLTWGVEFPFDPEHVTYVWVDALFNYLTASNGAWPPDIQLMGKDIMWFHCVIWPSLLMATGYELPKREVVHGFINVDGSKMSKSLGNVIDPLELAEEYGADFVRYLLIAKVPFRDDGNIVRDELEKIYRELAGSIGNLANRVLRLMEGVRSTEFRRDPAVFGEIEKFRKELEKQLRELNIEKVLDIYGQGIQRIAHRLNSYINEREPWKLDGAERDEAVLNAYRGLVELMKLAAPMLVEGARKFFKVAGDGKPGETRLILYPPKSGIKSS